MKGIVQIGVSGHQVAKMRIPRKSTPATRETSVKTPPPPTTSHLTKAIFPPFPTAIPTPFPASRAVFALLGGAILPPFVRKGRAFRPWQRAYCAPFVVEERFYRPGAKAFFAPGGACERKNRPASERYLRLSAAMGDDVALHKGRKNHPPLEVTAAHRPTRSDFPALPSRAR